MLDLLEGPYELRPCQGPILKGAFASIRLSEACPGAIYASPCLVLFAGISQVASLQTPFWDLLELAEPKPWVVATAEAQVPAAFCYSSLSPPYLLTANPREHLLCFEFV